MIGSLSQYEFLKLQKVLGKTSKEIADICDVSTPAVKRWREGEARCSGENARKLLELAPDFFKDKTELSGKVKLEIDLNDLSVKTEPSNLDISEEQNSIHPSGINLIIINNNYY